MSEYQTKWRATTRQEVDFFFATTGGLYESDQVPADHEGEARVFFFDEEMTLASRMTEKMSQKNMDRRRRLEQKLMMKNSK